MSKTRNEDKVSDIIVKSNYFIRDFVQHCNNLIEKRLVYAFFSVVDSVNDAKDHVYVLSMTDILRLLELSDGGRNYINIREQLKTINDMSFWQRSIDANGQRHDKLVRLFKDFSLDYKILDNANSNVSAIDTCTFVFSDEISRALMHQKKNFTRLLRSTIMQFKSIYSPSFYEYLMSFCYGKKFDSGSILPIEMDEDEVCYHLGFELNTPAWKIARTLPTVVKEINEFSETITINDFTWTKTAGKRYIAKFNIIYRFDAPMPFQFGDTDM